MKTILGIGLIIIGIILGIYIGVWVLFIGGIMVIANGLQSETLTAVLLAWGLIRIVLASFVGWASFIILALPGMALIATD